MSSNIDHIFYINLDDRDDRMYQIEFELNSMGLNYERFPGIRDDFGLYGCGCSHLAALKLAKERGYKNVLILEDDFKFVVSKEVFENFLNQFFTNVKKFDVCMLAYNTLKMEDSKYPFVKKVIESQTAAGYIVNSYYYDKLIDLYEMAMPKLKETNMHWIFANDQIWKRLQPIDIWYQSEPRIGKQRASYSNISNKFVDYKDC